MKKFLALILALLTVTVVLASCNNTETPNTSNGDASEVSTTPEYELFSNLPDKNYADGDKKAEFTILTIGDWANRYKSVEILPHELSAELIQESVIERNALVEERFGVEIKEIRTSDTSGMLNDIRSNAATGSDLYDVVMPYMTDAAVLSAESLFYDLNDEEGVKFDGAWWDQNAKETLSIGDKLYFVTGDLNILAYDCTHCLVFNRDLANDHNIDPYALVDNGEWTLDKLLSIAKDVTTNDGDGDWDFDDTWGAMINANFATSMFLASGERLTEKDEDDLPIISVMGDRQTSVFGKIYDLCSNDAVCQTDASQYISMYPDVWLKASEAVATKHVLFRSVAVVDIFEVADFECSFGVLPTPKFDEEQENYYSNVSAICATCVAIPTSNNDYEQASIIMDAMAQASTKTVKTAYYDNVLKLRKLADDKDERMLDIIFDGRVYDYAILFQWGTLNTFMNDIAFSGTNSFQSSFESIEGSAQTAIEKTLDGMGVNY